MEIETEEDFRALTSEDNVEYINERVDVVAAYEQGGGDQKKCFPRKMKFRNRTITFTELGFRHPTSQGNRMIHVFDMSDGNAEYRIEFDAEALTWNLISSIAVED